jgi:hypothetical protein
MKKRAADSHYDLPFLMLERTHAPALGAGLLLAEVLRLPLCRHLQGASKQRSHRSHRDLLHLSQINVEARTFFTPMLLHDDFSPAPRQFLNPANIL